MDFPGRYYLMHVPIEYVYTVISREDRKIAFMKEVALL